MNVKKFSAPTSREALRKVRESLGPDAVILSNRQSDGGVEILALANDDAASLSSPAPHSPMADPVPSLDLGLGLGLPAGRVEQRMEPRFDNRAAEMPAEPVRRIVASPSSYASKTAAAANTPAPSAPAQPRAPSLDVDQITAMVASAVASAKQNAAAEMQVMMGEIRAMRGMMETQLAEIAWGLSLIHI